MQGILMLLIGLALALLYAAFVCQTDAMEGGWPEDDEAYTAKKKATAYDGPENFG